ncbi:hypothetical protein [Bacillus thuringiensis]|uniref:hypothetical protein n=1 Tax=Bacillus thuringiensis TaxID=1428 RepID=UPI000BFD7868|nr:hypothetical protein [Bacillus thuringiensis]PGX96364.1 hypothetical protein COE39_10065 [Bacillus thuringiensis]
MLKKEKYEIKFFLNLHRVLNEKFELGCEIIDEFGINLNDVDETYIQFIDTKNRDMYTQGLILRNRIKREENACELTYKKRYEIVKDDIQGALEKAKEDGFVVEKNEFNVEIDWGLTNKILNIVYKPDKQPQLSGLELPSVETLREMFFNNGPQIFFNSGKEIINHSDVYGPVFSRKFKGTLKNKEVNLEIWSMAECKEPIVEISLEKFKSDEKDEANQYYNELKELLSTKVNGGWILEGKFSKTDWVMKKCK